MMLFHGILPQFLPQIDMFSIAIWIYQSIMFVDLPFRYIIFIFALTNLNFELVNWITHIYRLLHQQSNQTTKNHLPSS